MNKFLMVVTGVDYKTGDVTLRTVEGKDVPATMIWHYGADASVIEDSVGDAFIVTLGVVVRADDPA